MFFRTFSLVVDFGDERESLYFTVRPGSVRNKEHHEYGGLLIAKDYSSTRSLLWGTLSKAFSKLRSRTDTKSPLSRFWVMPVVVLVFKHTIFEAERVIIRKIYTQHVTLKESWERRTREELLYMTWLGLADVVIMCDLSLFSSNMLFSLQPKYVLQKRWTSYCWCHDWTSQYREWCDFHVGSYTLGSRIMKNL